MVTKLSMCSETLAMDVQKTKWNTPRFCGCFVLEQFPARIITTSQCGSNVFPWVLIVILKKIRKIVLAHGLPNTQHLLAPLDFYSPWATGRVKMLNPVHTHTEIMLQQKASLILYGFLVQQNTENSKRKKTERCTKKTESYWKQKTLSKRQVRQICELVQCSAFIHSSLLVAS